MSSKAGWRAFLFLMVCLGPARTAEPDAVPSSPATDVRAEQDAKVPPKQPDKDKKLTEPPKIDIFAQAPLMGPLFPLAFHPSMMGDFPGTFARRTFTVFGTQTVTTTGIKNENGLPPSVTTTTTVVAQTRTVVVPAFSATGFKIAENESPRPQDRVFFTYNRFGNLQGLASDPGGASASTQTISAGGPGAIANTVINTVFPATPRVQATLYREIFGFEKTFLDGFASLELRVPLLQAQSNIDAFSSRGIGDLTFVGKYAFILDPDTGNVLSAGLAVTAPTGPSIPTIDGNLHSTLLQPWIGYIWNADRFFIQAFHSVVVPTDARDVTLLFNDVGLYYWLYRGDSERTLRFVVPMVEAHVTTPLNQRGLDSPIFVPDLVVLTGGVHFGLFGNATLSLGAATPVTGPRIFGTEAFVQLNWRF